MINPSKFSKWKQKAGIVLVILLTICFPFFNYYLRNFYAASLDEYRNWYPRTFLIIYPMVKAAPFLIGGLLVFLLWDSITTIILKLRYLPHLFLNIRYYLIRWARKNLPGVLILVITLSILLPTTEFFLLRKGFKPGYRLYSIYFQPKDSLYDIVGFYADSNGIFCVGQAAREYIANELANKKSINEITSYKYNENPEVYSLAEDYLEMRDTSYQSTFKSFTTNICMEQDSSEREFAEAINQFLLSPININGFRSIEFKTYNSRRKKILLLGDSFTWGHSASNKTNGFADLLLAKGYIVYNTGISGTDPAQYLRLAELLVPQLKPDFVIVNFFMGNDIQHFRRELVPYVPVMFCTNAGNLVSCPTGVYLKDQEEAYAYALSLFTIPIEHNWFNRLCAKTAFGTLVWRGFAQAGLADLTVPRFIEYSKEVKKVTTTYPYSNIQVRDIRSITQTHGGKFILMVIPELEGRKFINPDSYEGLFDSIMYFVPNVGTGLYNTRDGHFNDAGHVMYANLIDSLLTSR